MRNPSILLITEDDMMHKLLDYALESNDIDLNRMELIDDDSLPSEIDDSGPLVIYDIPSRKRSTNMPCCARENSLKPNNTKQIVISTFPIDCSGCSKFKTNSCCHFSKPFRVSEILDKIRNYTQ